MKKIIVVFFLLLHTTAYAECMLPEALEFCYGPYDANSRVSTSAGVITRFNIGSMPNTAEIALCRATCTKEATRADKKDEIKAEAVRRAQLIDPDFTEGSISLYRRLNVGSLDSDGLAIRALLIYGYQKAQWANTASEQDIAAYDPEADNGWP